MTQLGWTSYAFFILGRRDSALVLVRRIGDKGDDVKSATGDTHTRELITAGDGVARTAHAVIPPPP